MDARRARKMEETHMGNRYPRAARGASSIRRLLLLVTVMAVALYGCGTDESDDGGQEAAQNGTGQDGSDDALAGSTMEFWFFGGHEGEHAWIEEKVAQFEEQTGIQVEVDFRDWARQREDILASRVADDVPDLMHVHSTHSAEFGEGGDLYALEQFDDFDEVGARFVPRYLEGTEYGGQHYGLPWFSLAFVMAYNAELFEEHGIEVDPDWTWDEFRDLVLELSGLEDVEYGYTIPGGANLDNAFRWTSWLYKAGGQILNDDWTEPAFNDEAGVAALEMLLELQEQGGIPRGNAGYAFGENIDLFGSERAAMTTEGPWLQGLIATQFDWEEGKAGIAPVPAHPNPPGTNAPGTLLDLTMVTIPANAQNREAAWELAKFLKSPENEQELAFPANSSGLPTLQAAFEEGVEWGYLGRETYLQEAENARPWPQHPQITEIQTAIGEGLNAAFAGRSSAQEALDQAAREVQTILDEADF